MMTTLNSRAIFANRSVLGPGNRLGRLEEAVIFDLAEVLPAIDLLRADDLRAAAGGLLEQVPIACAVFASRSSEQRHLREADVDGLRRERLRQRVGHRRRHLTHADAA